MRVYLSGPMTGKPYHNFPAFNEAAKRLRAIGLEIINPAEIEPATASRAWADCMRADIAALVTCDAIAMLPGWEDSEGAHLELLIAHRLRMKVTTPQRLLLEHEGRQAGDLDAEDELAFPTIFGDLVP